MSGLSSGGGSQSLQNSSAASAENRSESSNTVGTGAKVFNVSNRGSGMLPALGDIPWWAWLAMAAAAAYFANKYRKSKK